MPFYYVTSHEIEKFEFRHRGDEVNWTWEPPWFCNYWLALQYQARLKARQKAINS